MSTRQNQTDHFLEVDRALDNLSKSGKLFNAPSRRDSMPMMGGSRPYAEFGIYSFPTSTKNLLNIQDQRMGGIPPRHHSISDYEQVRPHSSSNLQSFYANQRHQPRPSEAEQMMQVKRKMAAQRERELRNYHQEQKSARANSPASMNEEERRTLIARQHRALYGDGAPAFYDNAGAGNESTTPRPTGQGSNASNSAGPSPLAYDPFGLGQNQTQASHGETAGQFTNVEQTQSSAAKGPSPKPQQRSRANSTSSPASNNQNFSLFENAAQQSSRTSTSSPGGSPPRQAKTSVAPIGTGVIGSRAAPSQALNKRSTTPLPSPLSYGFAPNESANANERSTPAASNPTATPKDSTPWGGNWGGKTNLGVQQSVWG